MDIKQMENKDYLRGYPANAEEKEFKNFIYF
jgi:hypothetical protein